MEIIEQLQSCDWKGFEKLIKEVLEIHNFTCFWNVNLTIEGKRRQYDVIAVKGKSCLLIECKKWDNKKSKVSALKTAVSNHLERCKFYELLYQKKVIPVLITYNEDAILEYEKTFIVPLNKLNDYLLNVTTK